MSFMILPAMMGESIAAFIFSSPVCTGRFGGRDEVERLSARRRPGDHHRRDDIGQEAAAACGTEQDPGQPDQRGVQLKIFRDTAADAVHHLIRIGFIQSLVHIVSPFLQPHSTGAFPC